MISLGCHISQKTMYQGGSWNGLQASPDIMFEAGAGCTDCHHKMEGDQAPKPCSECHDAKEAKGDSPKLRDAVHANCYECHQKHADAGEATGPVKKECKSCHIKSK